jgi:hypothetical protein
VIRKFAWTLAALLFHVAAQAHPAPNSVVSLDFDAQAVRAEMFVPVSELAAAAIGPGADAVGAYLLGRVSMESPSGARWTGGLRNLRRMSADGHDYWVARFDFTPPAGASARELVFIDDAVTHEVRNHVVTVLARSDSAVALAAGGPLLLGVLQYPARSLTIRRPDQNSH